ncbi:MAG: hypothetical protein E6I39_10690 [Chloroflexi bacterium]|nr:MAG: hypothetical protein E6I39_10690 [Chloroflexota bacterium]
MKNARGLIENPHVFDTVVVLLTSALLFGAYLTAYAFVIQQNEVVEPAGNIGQGIVLGAWLTTTGVLFAAFARGLRAGKPWHNALPDGYVGSLTAALTFGAARIVDNAFRSSNPASGGVGLDALFTPPRLVLIAATAVMVSGPLRAAARRGETTAGISTLVSAALLLSVLTFVTQFIHPLIDPYALLGYRYTPTGDLKWLGENIGVASILAQALILAGTGLLLNSGFKLRPGSLTLVFAINGLFVTISKLQFEYMPVMIATGVAADVWIAYSARRPGRPSASLCAVIGGAFVVAYMIEIFLKGGTSWANSLWAGTIVATTMMCWMMGRLLRAGLPAAIVAPLLAEGTPVTVPVEVRHEVRWTRDPASTVRPQLVRAALDDLGTPEALGRSPLGGLAGIAHGESTAADLRAALVDVISELAASPQPRDAEAGRLLLDYYVKKVGSHEVIMERLHLSRPTFYRRLQRGFALVAERLDEMSEFAEKVPVAR